MCVHFVLKNMQYSTIWFIINEFKSLFSFLNESDAIGYYSFVAC